MGAAARLYSYRPTRGAQSRSRFLLAGCASLLVHLWLASELPASVSGVGGGSAPLQARAGGGSAPLEVRLQPPALEDEARRPAIEAEVATVSRDPRQSAPEATRSRTKQGAGPPLATDRRGAVARSAHLVAPLDPTYYPARELDDYPVLLTPLRLSYPQRATAEKNRAGHALVMVSIDAAGRVDETRIVEADPAGYFEEAVSTALATAVFSPARRSGLPVKSRVLIRLEHDASATATQTP